MSRPGGVPSDTCEVIPSGPVTARVRAPASKSVTNRLLLLAALAEGTSTLHGPLESDDSRAMLDAVRSLGAQVRQDAGAWTVQGTAGRPRTPARPLHAGLSGTTMRFLPGVATLAPDGAVVTGEPPLLRRPVGDLVDTLRQLGGRLDADDGYPPVRVAGGGLDGGDATVDVTRSSQFASGVLLVAPYARSDVRLRLRGEAAVDYVALTAEVMREWGAEVDRPAPDTFVVTAGRGYSGRAMDVEYDASTACHLFAIAMATGGAVTVTNVPVATSQPDAALLGWFERMGGTVIRDGASVTVSGPEALAPVQADLSSTPDQVTTMAALAALADGVSELSGVAVARTHETDRLAALRTELSKLGVRVDESHSALRIHGGRVTGPAVLDTYDDHRLAMAFAALAARVGGVRIAEPWCVTKTYPRFWGDLRDMGVEWREVGAPGGVPTRMAQSPRGEPE